MQHAPSGSFNPIVDSFGRVLYTRWDHLQRDQQAELQGNGTFNWASEEANAVITTNAPEVILRSSESTAGAAAPGNVLVTPSRVIAWDGVGLTVGRSSSVVVPGASPCRPEAFAGESHASAA